MSKFWKFIDHAHAFVKGLTIALMVGLFAMFLIDRLTCCTPQERQAVSASVVNVEDIVAADLAKGRDLPEIEVDVALTLHVGNPTVDALVVELVDDALAILIDSETLPANLAPIAENAKTQSAAHRRSLSLRTLRDGGL